MTKTTIAWTEYTWNPYRGTKGKWFCTKVSRGCSHCYAERMNMRFSGIPYRAGADTLRFDMNILLSAYRWNSPRIVFVNSMSDTFHPEMPEENIRLLFKTMMTNNEHIYQVLTKRPERMYDILVRWKQWREYCQQHNNIWLGVTVENEDVLDRIIYLRKTPSAVRFISFEPLLDRITAFRLEPFVDNDGCGGEEPNEDCLLCYWKGRDIHWAIVGGESGPASRAMKADWARDIRDVCADAGISFFMKQLGGWPDKHEKLSGFPDDLQLREFPAAYYNRS